MPIAHAHARAIFLTVLLRLAAGSRLDEMLRDEETSITVAASANNEEEEDTDDAKEARLSCLLDDVARTTHGSLPTQITTLIAKRRSATQRP